MLNRLIKDQWLSNFDLFFSLFFIDFDSEIIKAFSKLIKQTIGNKKIT